MKAIIFFLLLLNFNQVYAQKDKRKDSILNNDYSIFKPGTHSKEPFKFFEAPPPNKSSLVIIDNKIYKGDSDYFKNFPKTSLHLLDVIKDTLSTSGVYYIYIYKTK